MLRALVPKYNHRIGTILLRFSIIKVLYFWSIYIKFGYYNGCELKNFPVLLKNWILVVKAENDEDWMVDVIEGNITVLCTPST